MRADVKKMLTMFFLSVALVFSFFSITSVFAQTDMLGTEYAAGSGLGNADPRIVAGSVIRAALGLAGIIALAIFLYSGFEWMTSLGNEQKVEKAKKRIWYTVIGLAILFCAYAITILVFRVGYESTTGRMFRLF